MARHFDQSGAEQYLISANETDTSGLDDFTISAWVKFANTTGDQAIIASWDDTADKFLLEGTGAAPLGAFVDSSNDYRIVTDESVIVTDTWQHFLLRRIASDNILQLYVDGILIADSAAVNPILDANQPIFIGSVHSTKKFSGDIADVAIWNTALSDSDIAELAGLTKRPDFFNSGLIHYWKLDGTGATELDSAGSLDLSVNGATPSDSPSSLGYRSHFYDGGRGDSSVTCEAPAGLVDGDILLYLVYKENTSSVTFPAGFTVAADVTAVDNAFRTVVAWKRAASESGTYTASWTGSDWCESFLVALRGCITTGDPQDAAATSDASIQTDLVFVPSITTATPGALILHVVANWDEHTVSAPSMYVKRAQEGALAFGDRILASPGASGDTDWPMAGAATAAGIALAFKPATGGDSFNDTQTQDDTGTATDSNASIEITIITDSGTGTDIPSSANSSTQTDTGSSADAILENAYVATITDATVSVTDVIIPAYISTLSDTGTDSEAVLLVYNTTSIDTATGTDSYLSQYGFSITDTAEGVDSYTSQYGFTVTDTTTSTDDIVTTSTYSGSVDDTSVGTDASAGISTITVIDSGVGTDTPITAYVMNISDTGAGVDAFNTTYTVSILDTASGTDAVLNLIAATISDATILVTDNAFIELAFTVTESGIASDEVSYTYGVPEPIHEALVRSLRTVSIVAGHQYGISIFSVDSRNIAVTSEG